jgi:drug/metabolite transporter (DMT)-like permease
VGAGKLIGLTSLAMVAFAANSVLGRMGLLGGDIGAGSFALVRLVSGALVLGLIAGLSTARTAGSWRGGLALFIYAAFFSYAYLELAAGTGALLLFAMVQITMVGAGLFAGERFTWLQWVGLIAALFALVWLLSPGLEAPPLLGALAMLLAGVGWGIYSLIGRTSPTDSTATTAGNFLRASLIGIALLTPFMIWIIPEPLPGRRGVFLAILSGAVTSGLGYAIWYMALKGLSATKAGVAQLTVPAIAALGGVLLLDEALTLRFALASLIILAGVGVATLTAPAEPATEKTD